MLSAISGTAGNQAVCKLLRSNGGAEAPPAPQAAPRSPHVTQTSADTLEVRVGEIVVARIRARGKPRALERLRIADDS